MPLKSPSTIVHFSFNNTKQRAYFTVLIFTTTQILPLCLYIVALRRTLLGQGTDITLMQGQGYQVMNDFNFLMGIFVSAFFGIAICRFSVVGSAGGIS